MPETPIEPREHYVYALYREDGVTPFYIGMGKGDRWMDHETLAQYRRRSHKWNIIKGMLERGMEVPKAKLAEGLTRPEAMALEMGFIAKIGRRPNGPLVNLTAGGDGVYQLSADVVRRRAASLRRTYQLRPELREKVAERFRRKRGPRSEETKAKLRAINLGNKNWEKMSPETRERVLANLRLYQTKAAEALRAKSSDPDYRAKKSAAQKRRWAEYRRRRSD